jgi:hypothetical protein
MPAGTVADQHSTRFWCDLHIAKTQMQAQQMAVFTLLPSLLLSGFLFPFAGMPVWARFIGNALPLTHIVRICRGVLLKGNGSPKPFPTCGPCCCSRLWSAPSHSGPTDQPWIKFKAS